MPRDILMLPWLLKLLKDHQYSDLIQWNDPERKTFRLYFQHGNSRKRRTQQEAAALWTAWAQLKKADKRKVYGKGQWLTTCRQRFRQGIKSLVKRNQLRTLDCQERHYRVYEIVYQNEEKEKTKVHSCHDEIATSDASACYENFLLQTLETEETDVSMPPDEMNSFYPRDLLKESYARDSPSDKCSFEDFTERLSDETNEFDPNMCCWDFGEYFQNLLQSIPREDLLIGPVDDLRPTT